MAEELTKLVTKRGPAIGDRVPSSGIIRELSLHTGLTYDQVASAVYGFLHYVKYSPLSRNHAAAIRGFGSFRLSRTKGRVYGKHVGAPTAKPDRMRLVVSTPLMEVDRWKSMQSIQPKILSAQGVEPKQFSMDRAVCARIVDLALSNKPLSLLKGRQKMEMVRQWVYALGVSPLLPVKTRQHDLDDREFHVLRYTLRGTPRVAAVFDFMPDPMFLRTVLRNPRDIAFLPDGWILSRNVIKLGRSIESDDDQDESDAKKSLITPYGTDVESQAMSLFLAYRGVKYADQK